MNNKTKEKLLSVVRDNYEHIAGEFSNTRNYVWPELKNLITTEIKQFSGNYSVLDLGCGNGRLLELLENNKNINYTGIDQSNNLIALAQKKYPKTQFIQGDILKINEIIEKKYDLILLIAVLQHIPSNELRIEFLKKIKNILKPNGKIIISNWNLRKNKKYKKLIYKNNLLKVLGINKMDFNDIIFTGFNTESKRYYHAFSKKELQKILEQAGFIINKLYSDEHNIYTICEN